jgi:hypothetical protein
MARGRRSGTAEAESTTETAAPAVEDTASTTGTEAPAADTSTAAASSNGTKPSELTDEQVEAAIQPFKDAANAASEERDESTGVVPDASVEAVNKAYAALDGAKLKNAAKRFLNEAMKDAMNDMDVVKARSFMELNEKLKAGGTKAKKAAAPRVPADPTEAFVERLATLTVAYQLAYEAVPEGVTEDWQEKLQAAVDGVDADQTVAYRDWLTSEAEDKGDAPDVPFLIQAAVKLSLGRSAKPGKARKATSSGAVYDGPRRDIAKHIQEAFADSDSGTFKLISEIRKFKSSEYPDEHPSAGAISARLFPKSGKCTVEGITPDTNEKGDKGARKA